MIVHASSVSSSIIIPLFEYLHQWFSYGAGRQFRSQKQRQRRSDIHSFHMPANQRTTSRAGGALIQFKFCKISISRPRRSSVYSSPRAFVLGKTFRNIRKACIADRHKPSLKQENPDLNEESKDRLNSTLF